MKKISSKTEYNLNSGYVFKQQIDLWQYFEEVLEVLHKKHEEFQLMFQIISIKQVCELVSRSLKPCLHHIMRHLFLKQMSFISVDNPLK